MFYKLVNQYCVVVNNLLFYKLRIFQEILVWTRSGSKEEEDVSSNNDSNSSNRNGEYEIYCKRMKVAATALPSIIVDGFVTIGVDPSAVMFVDSNSNNTTELNNIINNITSSSINHLAQKPCCGSCIAHTSDCIGLAEFLVLLCTVAMQVNNNNLVVLQ